MLRCPCVAWSTRPACSVSRRATGDSPAGPERAQWEVRSSPLLQKALFQRRAKYTGFFFAASFCPFHGHHFCVGAKAVGRDPQMPGAGGCHSTGQPRLARATLVRGSTDSRARRHRLFLQTLVGACIPRSVCPEAASLGWFGSEEAGFRGPPVYEDCGTADHGPGQQMWASDVTYFVVQVHSS